jgi:CHAT domain-containing protein
VGYSDGYLAELYMAQGRMKEATQMLDDALTLFRHWYGPTHLRTTDMERSYAGILAASGSLNRALELALQAHVSRREAFSLAVRVLPERQALAFGMNTADSIGIALSIVSKHPDLGTPQVYQEVIRSRALVAEEMAKRQASLNRSNDPEIAAMLAELDKERAAALKSTSSSQNGQGVQQVYTDALTQMEKLERQLAERSLAFRSDQRVRTVALDDVRGNLPSKAVLVSYVKYGRQPIEASPPFEKTTDAYLAFVMHPNSDRLRLFDLGDAASIDELVKRARATVEDESHAGGMGSKRNERIYREAGEALRKRIWDPLRGELTTAKLALVVPDGSLSLIPFGSLPDKAGYLVEHGPVIHLLTSERDLVPSDAPPRKNGLLAIGSPTFDTASNSLPPSPLRDATVSCDQFKNMEFHPLPGSAAEVADISSTWRRLNGNEASMLVMGQDATRERFMAEASKSRVLHIATHAFLLDRSCGNGNPLQHSGLVFAGANQSREAGIVTAQQIAALDLSGVDWAVLSACNTGNGELDDDGEGVEGLERAFRVAGARSVVMALWPVDDNVTRRFMHTLYAERLGAHESTADSVWDSARKLLVARRAAGKSTHPWYWAGFVGSGGWK